MSFQRIAVVGAGAWGCALANAAARAGRDVVLWGRDAASIAAIEAHREAPRLPGIRIDERVTATSDPARLAASDAVLMVVPAQALRAVTAALAASLPRAAPLVICAKGIERGTRLFMSDVVAQAAPDAIPAILSGPSFASDVARGLPTAVTLAAGDDTLAAALAQALGSASFRPYHATDVRGVELGGAAKNVLAIAAGIVTGRKLGASATAALVTRGFAELARFGRAFGARPETLMGLSGLGDLVLSCSTLQSRNFSFGVAIGGGSPPPQAGAGKLAEGAFTAAVLAEMAAEKGVDMPIATAVADILERGLSVDAAVEQLMTRPFRAEG